MTLKMTDVSDGISHIHLLRNIKRVTCGLLMLFLSVSRSFSQPIFYSQSLQKLYYSLPPSCRLDYPVTDTIVFCNGIVQGVTVPVAYSVDNYGITAHVGYRFLSGTVDTKFLQHAVIRFLEREALALLVSDN